MNVYAEILASFLLAVLAKVVGDLIMKSKSVGTYLSIMVLALGLIYSFYPPIKEKFQQLPQTVPPVQITTPGQTPAPGSGAASTQTATHGQVSDNSNRSGAITGIQAELGDINVIYKIGDNRVSYNGRGFNGSQEGQPVLVDGHLFASDSYLINPLKCQTKPATNPNTGIETYTIEKNGVQLKLTIGDRSFTVNGEKRSLAVAPYLKQTAPGTHIFMLPIADIFEALGGRVTYL